MSADPNPTDGTILNTDTEFATASVSRLFLALDNVSAAPDEGHWFRFEPCSEASVEVIGSGTFSLQLCGSNAQNAPDDGNDGSALGSAITAFGITTLTTPVRWLKAKLSSLSGGGANITVRINGIVG